MNVYLGEPNEKQKQMLLATKKHVGFGGAVGGGKSWAVRYKAKALCFAYAGIKTMIIRRSYEELEKNHIRILKSELAGIVKYTDKSKLMIFPNSSTITFMYCGKDDDLQRIQGAEFDVVFVDEATQLTEYQLKWIASRVRGANNFPKRIYYTCNPGGVGHGYIKRIFKDKRYVSGERPEDYTFIQSLLTDNVVLMREDPEYIKTLEALPPKLRAAFLEGDWNVLAGQFFEEFKIEPNTKNCYEHKIEPETALKQRRWTHVIEPFAIPKDWIIYRSFDWGSNRPFSVGWWAVDGEGTLYRILEWYGCKDEEPNIGLKMTSDEVFAKIHSIETEHEWLKNKKIHGVADPAIWIKESTGISIYDIAVKHGVYFSKADNSRVAGWAEVHRRLKFDTQGHPKLYVFNTCKAFIRTIPLLVHDEHKVEDIDTDGEDHPCSRRNTLYVYEAPAQAG